MRRVRSAMAYALSSMGVIGLLLLIGCSKQVASSAPEQNAANQASPSPQETERVKAEFGVGAKGHSTGSPMRVTLNTVFQAQERLLFAKLHRALETYKAQDPYGRGPQSHEEFMEKIVAAYQLELPKLPGGHRYVYDPEAGQLMVERPAS